MTLERVKYLRKMFHNLVNEDRKEGKKVYIPLQIFIDSCNEYVDESTSTVFWDDDNEVILVYKNNNELSNPTFNSICPQRVEAYSYDVIVGIMARLDCLTSENFLNKMLEKGLTNEETVKKHKDKLAKVYDIESYCPPKEEAYANPVLDKRPERDPRFRPIKDPNKLW